MIASPTLFPEINHVLEALLAEIRQTLGNRFVGLILYGSLALGDFRPESSDIDFLVVTRGDLPAMLLPVLAAMHTRLAVNGEKWARKLEGPYIPQELLRRYDPARAWHPALRVDGSFAVDYHASDWILQRHTILQHGIALAGPSPVELIEPILPDVLRRAARAILDEWWAPMLADPTRLASREYQAYAVLTMCRTLFTIQSAEVVSKPTAARWAIEELGESWRELIEQALTWPTAPQPDRLEPTRAFIRYTIEKVGNQSCSRIHPVGAARTRSTTGRDRLR